MLQCFTVLHATFLTPGLVKFGMKINLYKLVWDQKHSGLFFVNFVLWVFHGNAAGSTDSFESPQGFIGNTTRYGRWKIKQTLLTYSPFKVSQGFCWFAKKVCVCKKYSCAKVMLNTFKCEATLHQQDFLFDLQPDRSSHITVSHAAPPIMPKLQRSRKESQEPIITGDQCHINGRSWLIQMRKSLTVIINMK